MARALLCSTSGLAGAQLPRSRSTLVVSASANPALPSGAQRGPPRPQRPNMCGVFQAVGSPVPVHTLLDVRDAYEACSSARTPAERRQCFEVYGLDADKVDRYYERVVEMERLIDQGDSVAQNLVTSGGALMLYVAAYCILRV